MGIQINKLIVQPGYIYNIQKEQSMNIEASTIIDLDEIIEINAATITRALCFQMSITKKYCLIGTEVGLCLVDNARKSFKRFQNQKNPFRKEQDTGVIMGAALQERCEVAVIPSKNSKKYRKTVVYIYDYQLNTILYSNDFFLPIRQITITDQSIIVSNNKRIILYNYTNDQQQKPQKYYLEGYASREPNTRLRYLQMLCEQKLMNNSIQEYENENEDEKYFNFNKDCLCGKYSISGVKPYKILFAKVFSLNGTKMTQLSIYDAAYDKDFVFQSFSYHQNLSFVISQDGNFVAYTENQGRSVNIKKVGEKGIFCNFFISNSIKECLSHGFFIENDRVWYTALRRGENSTVSMHFFKVHKKNDDKKGTRSDYIRYFSLFQKTIIDYGVSNRLLGPDFYVINGAVQSASICGAVIEVIDFNLSGRIDKKVSQNMVKWTEDLS